MNFLKSTFLLACFCTATISCVAEPEKGPSLAALPLRWNASALPLTVKVHNDFNIINELDGGSDSLPLAAEDDGDYLEYDLMEEMQKAWNDADSKRDYFVLGHGQAASRTPSSNLNDFYDGEVGIYITQDWYPEVGYGVLAITSYFAEHKGDYLRMVHGDIIVNLRDYWFTFDNTETANSFYDMPSVILHELGHLIGLKHTNSKSVESIMYPQLGGGEKKRTLSFYDSKTIENLYDNATAMTAGVRAAALGSTDASLDESGNEESDEPPKLIHGYIELRTDGSCQHYLDGKLIDSHKAF
ncbi:matrixin family metalloprotease [Halobacteriovorax sp. XZX-3]|uniref:matrixin family metalloprotease n=1 Tax=unclassified Halobacteriovorax TaxID=2639665 RepID=UPI003710D6A6